MLTITCEEAASTSIKGSSARVLLIGCKVDKHFFKNENNVDKLIVDLRLSLSCSLSDK